MLTVFADRNQFVSVLNNLIKNAIQACEQKNTDVDVLVQVGREEKYVRVDVIDQGIGIAEEDIDKIFLKWQSYVPISVFFQFVAKSTSMI